MGSTTSKSKRNKEYIRPKECFAATHLRNACPLSNIANGPPSFSRSPPALHMYILMGPAVCAHNTSQLLRHNASIHVRFTAFTFSSVFININSSHLSIKKKRKLGVCLLIRMLLHHAPTLSRGTSCMCYIYQLYCGRVRIEDSMVASRSHYHLLFHMSDSLADTFAMPWIIRTGPNRNGVDRKIPTTISNNNKKEKKKQ